MEARLIIEDFIAKNINSMQNSINELSKIYLSYVKVLIKVYEIKPLWKVFKNHIEPYLKIAQDQHYVESEARLLYAA